VERGDTHKVNLHLPDRVRGAGTSPRLKYVVCLQGGPDFANQTDVAVVVGSTYKRRVGGLQPYEVLVGPQHGFLHDTVIDCRWVITIQKAEAPPSTRKFRLPPDVMDDISVALVVGLQL
jgi:mRNA-degrading endonuclease toxin of MazEF toxin-antitoxin module